MEFIENMFPRQSIILDCGGKKVPIWINYKLSVCLSRMARFKIISDMRKLVSTGYPAP